MYQLLMLHYNLVYFGVPGSNLETKLKNVTDIVSSNAVNVDLVTCKYHRDLKLLILHSYLVEFSDNVVNNVHYETCKCS